MSAAPQSTPAARFADLLVEKMFNKRKGPAGYRPVELHLTRADLAAIAEVAFIAGVDHAARAAQAEVPAVPRSNA